MSLIVMERIPQYRRRSDPDLHPASVSLPSRKVGPLTAVSARALLALGLLLISTVIVYLGRDGYKDNAHVGHPLSLLASFYYSAVTLSTTGYGDIVPVSGVARLVNTLILTPIRVVFLILLIGTTLEVLAERTRTVWRQSRWRSKVADHTVIAGYGTKGRSAVTTLLEAGVPMNSIVVIDILPHVVERANAAGLAAVRGDATTREVLINAEAQHASRLVIAVDRDDSAVLIALTARQLSPEVTIIAAVREAENEPLLRQSGANRVVVSSDAAGRLLGMSTVDPAAGDVMQHLLDRGSGLDLSERAAVAAEVGRPAKDACPGVIAVLRGDSVLAVDDPRAAQVEDGDRLVLVSTSPLGSVQR